MQKIKRNVLHGIMQKSKNFKAIEKKIIETKENSFNFL